MKLLIYIPHLQTGGPQKIISGIAKGLLGKGVQVSLLVNKAGGGYWDQLSEQKIRLDSLDTDSRFPIRKLASYLSASEAELVFTTLDSVTTTAAARKRFGAQGKKYIARPANHLTLNSRELFKKNPLKYSLSWMAAAWAAHQYDHVVCQSEDIKSDLARYWVPQAKMTVINNFIDVASTPKAAITGEKTRYVSVGRLSAQKGYDILLDAISKLDPEQQSSIQFDIFGDGPAREALLKQRNSLGLDAIVDFRGHIADVRGSIAQYDYYVSSSRYEGFPNTVLEALAEGVPVLATHCPGGITELISKTTGLKCPPNSPVELAKLIATSLEPLDFSREAIVAEIREKFSTEKILHEYHQLLCEAAA
ncbi:MAG: glycosyltransferase [Planctomycetota bacterium]